MEIAVFNQGKLCWCFRCPTSLLAKLLLDRHVINAYTSSKRMHVFNSLNRLLHISWWQGCQTQMPNSSPQWKHESSPPLNMKQNQGCILPPRKTHNGHHRSFASCLILEASMQHVPVVNQRLPSGSRTGPSYLEKKYSQCMLCSVYSF